MNQVIRRGFSPLRAGADQTSTSRAQYEERSRVKFKTLRALPTGEFDHDDPTKFQRPWILMNTARGGSVLFVKRRKPNSPGSCSLTGYHD